MLFENAINCIANSISTLLFLPIWVNLMILLNKATPLIKSKRFTLNISLSVGLINILFSFACLICCLKNPQTIIGNNILWLDSEIQIYLGSLVDNLSATLLLFASLISFFIQLFAYKTIKEHPNYHRFYIYMNILNFSIFGLILSPNLIQTFIFSLFTSISCYLLSTFSQENPNEIKAKKLLVLDSFGNICFLCGLLNLIYFGLTFNSSQNIILLSYSNFIFEIDNLYSMLLSIDYTIISLLFITSIVIKLGQFPFFALLKTQTLPTLILSLKTL